MSTPPRQQPRATAGKRHVSPETGRRRSRRRDQALVLLLAGVVLLMPPVAPIFQIDAKIGGLPVTLLYLFGVWAMLIFGTARLARALSEPPEDPGPR